MHIMILLSLENAHTHIRPQQNSSNKSYNKKRCLRVQTWEEKKTKEPVFHTQQDLHKKKKKKRYMARKKEEQPPPHDEHTNKNEQSHITKEIPKIETRPRRPKIKEILHVYWIGVGTGTPNGEKKSGEKKEKRRGG